MITVKTCKKRAAIIGFGGMGQRHLAAYSKIGVDVVAISDLKPEIITKTLPDFDPANVYNSHLDLLREERDNIDILSVVTNGPTHAKVTMDASNAGIKNILCEKPMATNLSDAKMVIETCNRNNTRLTVNHIRRWSTNYRTLKACIDRDIIGEIRHIYFSCGSTGIGNFAIHFFDTVRFLTQSEPKSILGFLDKTGTPNPRGVSFVDPGGYGIIQLKNGSRFFLDTSEDTGVQYSFQIVGTYGRIIIDELNDTWQIRARSKSNRNVPYTRYGTDMEIYPFESAEKFDIVTLTARGMEELLTGKPISSTGEDGYKSLEMVIGLHLSDDRGNSKVNFPVQEQDFHKDVQIA